MANINVVIFPAAPGGTMNVKGRHGCIELMRVCGYPMIEWALRTAESVSKSITVFTGSNDAASYIGERAKAKDASCYKGEIDMLSSVLGQMDKEDRVLMLHANQPAISRSHAEQLVANEADFAMIAAEDALPSYALCCKVGALYPEIESIPPELAALTITRRIKRKCFIIRDDGAAAAAYDGRTLALCEKKILKLITAKHQYNGVSIIDPDNTYIGPDVEIAEDAVIWPNTVLTGKTRIGCGTEVKQGCNINDSTIGANCTLIYVVANDAEVGDGVSMGPFVNLRPNTKIASGCKVGDFVEVKNSNIGVGSKLPHLSYIGDADIGERVNVGCGCVFVNYDGVHKHRSTVGNDVFLGCQTNLVAPVSVGDGAYTAAGSTINKDVPADAMAFARPRQVNKEGYASKYRALKKGEN